MKAIDEGRSHLERDVRKAETQDQVSLWEYFQIFPAPYGVQNYNFFYGLSQSSGIMWGCLRPRIECQAIPRRFDGCGPPLTDSAFSRISPCIRSSRD